MINRGRPTAGHAMYTQQCDASQCMRARCSILLMWVRGMSTRLRAVLRSCAGRTPRLRSELARAVAQRGTNELRYTCRDLAGPPQTCRRHSAPQTLCNCPHDGAIYLDSGKCGMAPTDLRVRCAIARPDQSRPCKTLPVITASPRIPRAEASFPLGFTTS